MATTLLNTRSRYQHIGLVQENTGELVLYLDGRFQFGTDTEKTYHEALFGVPCALAPSPERALILGGGDGLGAREMLRYSTIKQIVLVELDPDMIRLARTNPLARINQGSMDDSRVTVLNEDAQIFLQRPQAKSFDVIIADFPAINNKALAALYTDKFYRQLFPILSSSGVIATQISESEQFMREMAQYFRVRVGHGFSLIVTYNKLEGQGFAFGSRLPFKIRTIPPGGGFQEMLPKILDYVNKGEDSLDYDAKTGVLEPVVKGLYT